MNERIEFMKRLIGAAEKLAPNRVPNGDDDMLRIWSEIIPLDRYPERVWIDAVIRWGRSDGEFMEVGTLERHARQIVREWEGDPRKRGVLEDHRNARLRARETSGALPPGTTFSTPLTANEPRKRGTGGMPPEARARLDALRKKPHPKKLTPAERGDQSRQALQRLDQLTFQTLENVHKRQTQQAKEAQQ